MEHSDLQQSGSAVVVSGVVHRYGDLTALNGISLNVPAGAVYGLLGPNGSGKSTLFRILSTHLLPSDGTAVVNGWNTGSHPDEVRSGIAVVFQMPSVDAKLTVHENLRHHGYCYGIRGSILRERITEALDRLGLSNRRNDLAENLSGGMKRKVEIAKGLLSRPRVMLMDEPTTGLDPRARKDFWDLILEINASEGITFLTTTHLLNEAELCDRVAILDEGRLVAEGTPKALKKEISGSVVEIQSEQAELLTEKLKETYDVHPAIIDHTVRFDSARGSELITQILDRFSGELFGITLREPTLEDVFTHHTGHPMTKRVEPSDDNIDDDSDSPETRKPRDVNQPILETE